MEDSRNDSARLEAHLGISAGSLTSAHNGATKTVTARWVPESGDNPQMIRDRQLITGRERRESRTAALRRSEQTAFPSASDDEVGGIPRAMRERPSEGHGGPALTMGVLLVDDVPGERANFEQAFGRDLTVAPSIDQLNEQLRRGLTWNLAVRGLQPEFQDEHRADSPAPAAS